MTKISIHIEEIEEPGKGHGLNVWLETTSNLSQPPTNAAEAIAHALLSHLNNQAWVVSVIEPHINGRIEDGVGNLLSPKKPVLQ